WFPAGALPGGVRARQRAIGELRGALDFREDVAVLAHEAQVARTTALIAWAESAPVAIARLIPPAFAFCALASIALASIAWAGLVPWSLVFLWLLVAAAATFRCRRRLAHVA